MSRDDSHIPPELQSALDENGSEDTESSDDRRDWRRVWRLLGTAAPSDEDLPDADDTWDGIQRHLEEESSAARRPTDRGPRRPSRRSARTRLWRWGATAAAALVLLIVAVWWTRPVALTAPPGTTMTRTLPDQSTVELHGDTRLTYPRSFQSFAVLEADRRVVHLDGEAYFDVSAGRRPFIVETASVRIKVLGTAFSVRSRAGESQDTHVALVEGRLRVTDRNDPKAKVTLAPGQATTRAADGRLTPARDTSLQRVLAWRRGGFAVTATPLPTLARSLERRFGQSIRLAPSIRGTARSDPLTLYYPEEADLESILHDVSMARGLTYRKTANGYVLASGTDNDSPGAP